MKQRNEPCQSQYFRTMEIIKNISDYRSRYQPIELQLQKEGGLLKQIYEKDKDDKKKIVRRLEQIGIKGVVDLRKDKFQSMKRTIDQKNLSQIASIDHDGLISEILFTQNKQRRLEEISHFTDDEKKKCEEYCIDNQIKVMICITMYSEPLQELQKSLEGIQDSLNELSENDTQIMPNQILVVVIYDGIENIRNQGDENGNNQEGDIIPYFCQYMDKQNNIDQDKTLEQQYKSYKFKKEIIQKYSQEQRVLFQQKTDQQKKQYILNDRYLRKKMQHKPGNEFNYEDVVNTMEYQYQQAKKYIEFRQNNAYVYQTVQTVKLKDKSGLINSQIPIFHVFKFTNGTKLSSHLWFFKGFCHEFQPEYCVLMDCGARARKGSVYNLIKELVMNDQVGGVCGTMSIELTKQDDHKGEHMDLISKFLNVGIFNIERCQKCEYDIGNLLDKQFESSLNFIQVLPGAYSAYRYKAFSTKYQQQASNDPSQSFIKLNIDQNNEQKQNILDKYLKSKLNPNYEHDTLEEANMFLAEDRVLCLLLFCNGYYLKYVRDAYVDVDPMSSVVLLILQRRRWINGSWFALNYVIKHFPEQLPSSGHTKLAKYQFIVCLVFARISQIMQYFVISFQIIWIYMILNTLTEDSDPIIASAIKQAIIGGYIFLEFSLIYLSLNYNQSSVNLIQKKEEKEKERKQINQYYYSKFYGISTILGLVSLLNAGYTFYLLIIELIINQSPFKFIDNPQDLPSYIYFIVLISFILTVLPFILQMFIDFKLVFEIAINSIHYIYFMPTYTHLFITYSFCRIDDLTWGTKGLTTDSENKNQSNKESDKKYQKYKFVVNWILCNVSVTVIFFILFYLEIQNIIVIVILSSGVMFCILQFAKFIGYMKYWINYMFLRKSYSQVANSEQKHIQRKTKKEKSDIYIKQLNERYRRNLEEGQTSVMNP